MTLSLPSVTQARHRRVEKASRKSLYLLANFMIVIANICRNVKREKRRMDIFISLFELLVYFTSLFRQQGREEDKPNFIFTVKFSCRAGNRQNCQL